MGIFGNRKKKKSAAPMSEVQKTLHKNLEFTASEQYRLLRTNIMFTIPEDIECPIIGVTSGVRGEGKSTTAINLSYVLAEKGYKVLLIDGDLRIPSIAKKMGMKSSPGLTDVLISFTADVGSWKTSIHPNWYILPSGEIPPNPSELLGSSRMEKAINKLKEHFDYIILDLPPINIVSDAMAIANFITGLVVVIREDFASKKDVEQCFRQIRLSNVNVLGVVMNGSQNGAAKYSKYRRSGGYKYYKYYRYQAYEKNPKGRKK